MYGQGNYVPQYSQGPPNRPPAFSYNAPHPSSNIGSGPIAPPPPSIPPNPMIHQGLSAGLPHVVQPAHPPVYQHGPPAQLPPMQQRGPPPPPPQPQPPQSIKVPVTVNTGQPHLHPLPRGYINSSSIQQNAQYPSSLAPSPRAPIGGADRPEMIRAPPPPSVLPPPLSQGQLLYRNPVTPPQPLSVIGKGLLLGQLLPHPPRPIFLPAAPASFASHGPCLGEDTRPPAMPPPPPPPPPSSPPPIPTSPPPPTSSPSTSAEYHAKLSVVPLEAATSMSSQLKLDSGTNEVCDSKEQDLESVTEAVQVSGTDHLATVDSKATCGMPILENVSSPKPHATLALPPPKPADNKMVRRIEVLCQFIARNGSSFEDMARTKEENNPEYAFLFGGRPGTEASIANEYFHWFKRKCLVEANLNGEGDDSNLLTKPSEIESSKHPDTFVVGGASPSPSDSDMDMEENEPEPSDTHNSGHRTTSLHEDLCLTIAASINDKEGSGSLLECGSPIRLLQDYASDESAEDDVPSFEDVSPTRELPSVELGESSLPQGFKCSTPPRKLSVSSEPLKVADTAVLPSSLLDTDVKTTNLPNGILENQISNDLCSKETSLGDANFDPQLANLGEIKDNIVKQGAEAVKVDKFGRLLREGASDSDSDGSRWSPKKRGSRSKSPSSFRHTGEYSGDKTRRGRDQVSGCFDFSRGRCRRGASCRFLHHGSTNSDGRRYRGRQHQNVEVSRDLRSSISHTESLSSRERQEGGEAPETFSVDQHSTRLKEDIKSSGMSPFKADVSKDVCAPDDLQHATSTEVVESLSTAIKEEETDFQEAVAQGLQEEPILDEISKKGEKLSEASSGDSSTIQFASDAETKGIPDKPHLPGPPLDDNARVQPTQTDISDGQQSQDALYLSQPPVTAGVPSETLDMHNPYQAAVRDESHQPPTLSQPSWTSLPPPSYIHGSTSTSIVQSTAFPPTQFQPDPLTMSRPYMPGEPSHSHTVGFHAQSFPLPDGPHHTPFGTESFRPGPVPFDNMRGQTFGGPDIPRDERFTHWPPQDSFLHPLPQRQQEHHLSHQALANVQNFQPLPNQKLASPLPAATSSFVPNVMHSQPLTFSKVSPGKQMQSFPGGNALSTSSLREGYGAASTTGLSYAQNQHSSFSLQHSAADSFQSHVGPAGNTDPAVRRYPFSFLDNSMPYQSSLVRGSKISTTTPYNLFASTFERPLGSTIFNSRSDSMFSASLPVAPSANVRDVSQGQRHISEGFVGAPSLVVREPRVADQYDPLFDSIESSAKPFSTYDHVAWGTNAPASMLRMSTSHGIPDAGEKRKKEVAAIPVIASSKNDEFGETSIDAEGGAVESGSPENVDDLGNAGSGDVEIDQVQSKSKSKKKKDSRSMRLFKLALADFVKDLLKPSWRQGNMSKEAFKTIVKKTVEKVSGSMKNHHIPKSQAKINQYVESSQRKLTKLVMEDVAVLLVMATWTSMSKYKNIHSFLPDRVPVLMPEGKE
ncbi:hypothetical protein Sjap_016675 [Stephania japonica]|uniref:C3H1-type domain-containing protein n=1 Tax=Stephania japonica TaxID=461633 RepID=A0AAP0NSM0_9MAGN